MVAIIDYGVGNLFSLMCSFKAIGVQAEITNDIEKIKNANKIILPGVGAFEDAIKKLRNSGMDKVVLEEAKNGKDIMGICLGMQLLFDKSYEYGEFEGLGLIKGEIMPIEGIIPTNYKIPHIGWNKLIYKKEDCKLLKYLKEGDCVYFVHSYAGFKCEDSVVATAEYGPELTAMVAKDNIYGCQFHPEKSGKVGLEILKAFCDR